MVFSIKKPEEKERIKVLLEKSNLIIQEKISQDGDEFFLYITASPETFKKCAEEMELKMKLIDDQHGNTLGYAPFKLSLEREFKVSPYEYELFTSYERARIIQWMFLNIDLG